MPQEVDKEAAGGRYGHRPKQYPQRPIEKGADDDLPHLGLSKGRQLQCVGGGLALEDRSGEEEGEAEGPYFLTSPKPLRKRNTGTP